MAIRMQVGEAAGGGDGDDAGGGAAGSPGGGAMSASERSELVEQCVTAVLEALRRQSER